MGTVYQTAKKLGGSLYLDSGCLVNCKRPEFFLTPDSDTLTLVSLRGSEVEKVIFKDSNEIPYKIVGDNLKFETQPTVPIMVAPIKNLSVTQFLRNDIPMEIFFKTEPGQIINNMAITSVDFLTDLVGSIKFSDSKDGVYSEIISLASDASLWVKGTATATQSSMSTYITISGEIYL